MGETAVDEKVFWWADGTAAWKEMKTAAHLGCQKVDQTVVLLATFLVTSLASRTASRKAG
jgi:hypothetical protein